MALTHNSTLAKSEPSWGSVDKGKLPHGAFARAGDGKKKSTWGFPHHWVSGGKTTNDMGCFTDGTMFLHRGGLKAAWSAANGGRSGKRAEPAVLAHLRKHMAAIKMSQAELLVLDPKINVTTAELLADGALKPEDLQAEMEAQVSRMLAEPVGQVTEADVEEMVAAAAASETVSAEKSTIVIEPAVIRVSPTGGTVSNITVTARNVDGDPISGATVTLTPTGAGIVLAEPKGVTDAAGVATGTVSATQIGPIAIAALINSVPVAQATAVAAEEGKA